MNRTAFRCSDDNLRALLSSGENDAANHAAAEHLDTCTDCQSRIVALAADDSDWDRARNCLRDDAAVEVFEQERAGKTWITDLQSRPPKSWEDAVSNQLLSSPSHPEMLGRLGRYEIERLIGSGGMGIVFKGFDSELNRPVAVKVLAPHLAGSGAARQRFAREARAAAAVVHEHVVAIHNVESEAEPPFLVMPYIAGESLQGRIDRVGPLEVCEILRIAHQTAAALAAAHKQGLVHRDVKPSNIMLEQGVERALLTDFGLARASDDASLTHSGHVPGTPHYMSPEQARGEGADHRSDLFSLGSVMYTMCTGRLPFRAESSYGVLRRITDDEPTPVTQINGEIPVWLETIVFRLMEKNPEARLSSAEEAASLLEECLAHVQQPATAPLPAGLFPKFPPKRFAAFLTGGRRSVVLAVVGLIPLLLITFLQLTAPPDLSGAWHGDEWGRVTLEPQGPHRYVGTYNDPSVARHGEIDFAWSRIERRFNGTWRQGEDRFGDISVRVVDGKIHGAWSVSKDAKVNPATPALADLMWKRAAASSFASVAASPPMPGTTADNSSGAENVAAETTGRSHVETWDLNDARIRELAESSSDVFARINRSWKTPPSRRVDNQSTESASQSINR